MAARSPPASAKIGVIASREEVEAAEDAGQEEAQKAAVLSRHVDWQAYHDSGIITDRELGHIQQYDKQSPEEQNDFLNDLGRDYASFFVRALDKILDKDTVQYLLTLVHELLVIDPRRAVYFHEVKESYAPFMAILHRAAVAAAGSSTAVDTYSVLNAAGILGILLGEAGESADVATVTAFSKWLVSTLGSSTNSSIFRAREIIQLLDSIKLFLKSPVAQRVFAAEGGTRCFERYFIGATKSFQLIYVSGFCIWLLTFSKEEAVEIELKRFGIIKSVMEIIQNQLKEKVHRMCFNILRNLLRMRHASEFLEQLVGFDAGKVLATLSAKKWKDIDIGKDVTIVLDAVTRKISELSSFEMYVTELETKSLRWGPVHSEQFWSEHKTKFEEKNFDYIRKLVSLLDSPEEQTQEVTCYDLGEFARFHPEGKRLVAVLGGKSKLMARMASPNVKIAKQALLAVQKLMVQNWEFLQKGGK